MVLRRIHRAHFLIDQIIAACREVWSNEGVLPRHVEPWKSIKEVQQILGECALRPFLPLSLKALRMKAKIFQSASAPGMNTDIHAEPSHGIGHG